MTATLTRTRSQRAPADSDGGRRWADLDWILLLAVLALGIIGCLLVWSATAQRDELTGGASRGFLLRQVVNLVLGLGLAAVVVVVDHRWVRILAPVGYLLVVVGLVLVLMVGATVNGSRSWLMVGSLSLQPSELAKLAVVVGMALIVAERNRGHFATGDGAGRAASDRRWHERVGVVDVLLMLAVAAVPGLLILAQPDLGTVLVLTATTFGVIAASGAARRWLVLLAGGTGAVIWLAVSSGFLADYQLDRFLAFTDPGLDPRGAGYNVEQARIAVGNGGVFGQGLFDGSQTRAGFVPEQHTDFIFTVAGEELGLVGALVIVALLGVVLWRALVIASRSDDVFGRITAAGIACWLGFQAFQNVGMCLGIMPVTGVPLPFVSYGGSSMFACLLAVGLLQSIHLRTLSAPSARLQPR